MICPHCGAENPPNARFCNNCGRPLPRVCANCGAENPPGARFCNQCGMPLDSVPAAAPAAPPIPAAPSTVPAAGADGQGSTPSGGVTVTRGPRSGRLGGSAAASGARTRRPSRNSSGGAAVAEAEPASANTAGGAGTAPDDHTEQRRVVSVLFADVTGSTAMADAMDAEDVRSLLGAFFARMARAIHRHGGTVEKYIGDAVMAVFGLPTAHEDDPIRAVRAALDMRAALRDYNEQRRALDPDAVELQMRIGINTGEVVAASGAAEGRDFLITGDPVNVAARLQQTAAPGGILVGPRTYRGTTGAVVYRALAPITVRGKARPIRVWEAVSLVEREAAPSPRPRGVQGVRTPLVGRDAELGLLRALYARVVGERRPHLVTIVGAPGVGKTRLAREFIETTRAEDAAGGRSPLFLHGRCPQYGEAITYWPLSEMLRALGGFTAMDAPETARRKLLAAVREALRVARRDEDAETLAAYLGYTIGIETPERRQALLPSESQQMQEGLFRAWRVFFEALAARRPLLLLVDDIQWADDILLDLLEYVAAKAGAVSLLLICPARPELLERRPGWGGGRRNYAIIGLEALTDGDAERLVRALLPGDDVPERLRRGILRKGEGNPFYFEEIVRMLVDRGILVRDEATGNWRIAPEWEGSEELYDPAIPDTVQGVLAARLDLLSEPERDVLQHAAVIGRYFWPEALIALHPHLRDQLDAALDALRAKDLIHESERSEASVAPPGVQLYTFNHALTREVTYATIPRTRRAHEHQQVAEFLEGLAKGREAEFADVIAQHYRQYYAQANLSRERNGARRLAVRDKVVHYLTLAGEQAAGRHAGAKAVRYFTDALALLEEDARAEDVPARVQLSMRRGDAHWSLLRGDEAWADYREALRLWSSFSAYMVEGEARPDGTIAAAVVVGAANGMANGAAKKTEQGKEPEKEQGAISAPVGADGAARAVAELNVAPGAPLALPLDWRTWGLRLYRLLVQLPTRSGGLFQQPPAHEELLQYLQEGLRLAEEMSQHETLEGAALLTAKAFFWWSWGERRGERELLDALRSAREAVRITEGLDDPSGASEALDALGNIQAITNDLRGNLESQTRRLHWARRLDDPTELVDINGEVCSAYTLVGEYATAAEHGQRALDLAEASEADPLRARALRSLALAFFEWDHWPETMRLGERLQALTLGPTPLGDTIRWALLAWAIALARTGEREAADDVARRALGSTEGESEQFIELFKARLALARGAMKEARQRMLLAIECRSGRVVLPALLADLAELGARTGDREMYDRFGAQALELGWRSGARKPLAQAFRARGVVAVADARWDDALSDLETALSRQRELGTTWEQARTRYALAGLYQRRGAEGDADQARDELGAALSLFEGLGAPRDIARARAALAGGDVRLP